MLECCLRLLFEWLDLIHVPNFVIFPEFSKSCAPPTFTCQNCIAGGVIFYTVTDGPHPERQNGSAGGKRHDVPEGSQVQVGAGCLRVATRHQQKYIWAAQPRVREDLGEAMRVMQSDFDDPAQQVEV